MPQDAFSIQYTATELNQKIKLARVDKITQPTNDSVVLFLRAGKENLKLYICANAQNARVCLTKNESTNPIVAPSFCMLLRKHLSSAIIENVENILGERIIRIDFESKNELRESGKKQLYVELMGKFSNIILTENQTILGGIKQTTLFDVSRPILSGVKYQLPLKQDKISPKNTNELLEFFKNKEAITSELIFDNISGISKATAFEIVESFLSRNNLISPAIKNFKIEDFISYLQNFYYHAKIKANVITANGKPTDFFVCDYTQVYGKKLYFQTINEAIDYYFFTKENQSLFNKKQSKLLSVVSSYNKKLEKRLQTILEKELACSDLEKNRIFGELLIANLYQLKNGESSCKVFDYTKEDYPEITIKLDPTFSIKENAEKYFKKYNKQKKTLIAIKPQKLETLEELEYVKGVFNELDQAESIDDLSDIEEELTLLGLCKGQNIKKREKIISKPRKFEYNGFEIFVGRNNLQNDRLTLSADKNDLFLHTKDYHSSHVIIKSENREIPDEVILYAAELCVYYSKARNGTKIPVDYTFRKNVKKPSSMSIGKVIYTNFKTILADSHNFSN